jgi:hypothetical protein
MDHTNAQKFLKRTLVILTLFLLPYALFRRLDNDEFEAIHTTWKMLFDGQIYKDFFQHHHPFLYYLLSPFVYVSGENTNVIYMLRCVTFSMFLGIGYATYLLAKTLTNNTIALLSVIFMYSLPIFTAKAIEIRPDTPMVLCAMFALALLYLAHNHKITLIASALCLSLSFLFLQKAIIFIALFGCLMLWQRKLTLSELTLYGITFCILPTIYLMNTNLTTYIDMNWRFNFYMPGGCPPWYNTMFAIGTNIPFWICFALGLLPALTAIPSIVFFSTTLTTTFFLVQYSYSQYLLPALPFSSIIAAYGCYILTTHYKKLLIPIILLVTIPPCFTNYTRRIITSPVTHQIAKLNYILSITTKDDLVLKVNLALKPFRYFEKIWTTYGTAGFTHFQPIIT